VQLQEDVQVTFEVLASPNFEHAARASL